MENIKAQNIIKPIRLKNESSRIETPKPSKPMSMNELLDAIRSRFPDTRLTNQAKNRAVEFRRTDDHNARLLAVKNRTSSASMSSLA